VRGRCEEDEANEETQDVWAHINRVLWEIEFRSSGMKIGVIGSGTVGGTLGSRWAKSGHQVVFGSRHPGSDEMKKLVEAAGPTASTGSFAEVVAASDVVLLATPWEVTQAVVQGLRGVRGKVLIDATNPLLPDLTGMVYGSDNSGAEMVQRWAPDARVVKAFNTVGNNIMANPDFGADKPVLFYCGDDVAAKSIVKELAIGLGFDAEDAGPLTQARLLEPFALLWISLALLHGYGREIAFKFLRR
jgi:NADPH-dependent F420 reductase